MPERIMQLFQAQPLTCHEGSISQRSCLAQACPWMKPSYTEEQESAYVFPKRTARQRKRSSARMSLHLGRCFMLDEVVTPSAKSTSPPLASAPVKEHGGVSVKQPAQMEFHLLNALNWLFKATAESAVLCRDGGMSARQRVRGKTGKR
ncbi:uncharacterized protein ACIQIH_003503 [Cyanocitta cristata]